MPLIEGAAARVLPAETDGNSGGHKASECQGFCHAIVDGTLARAHFGALFEQLFDLGMNVEVFGICGELLSNLAQLVRWDSSVHFVIRLVAPTLILVPIFG